MTMWQPPTGAPVAPTHVTVAARHLTKQFRGLVAVSDVTFEIGPGVTALLGPNGAGKSTVLRMLSGLSPASQGRVFVMGGDPRNSPATRRQIGIVPQQDGVFERETAYQFVHLAAVLNGLDNPDAATRQALAAVELDPDFTRPMGKFSKGMRQRAKIASAIVHQPAVLFLDEPLNGLDPQQRRHMIALFHRLGEQGCTVIVSSHVLDEVERFGSNVLVMISGRLAAHGDFRAIRGLMDDRPARFRIMCNDARRIASSLIEGRQIDGLRVIDDTTIEAVTANASTLRSQIARVTAEASVRLLEFTPLDDDLDSVFRYLVETKP